SREYGALRGKGRRWATSSYRGDQCTPGEALCKWVRALQSAPWILCRDSVRRKPGDILLEPDPDYEDVPIAELDKGLAKRLQEEGVRFGIGILKSPALRRLMRKGIMEIPDAELAELLGEVQQQVAAGGATQDELGHALQSVRVRGRVPIDRLVERTGAGV